MRTLLLVTPAWRRLELTRLMLEQRLRTFAQARGLGVECDCVVVADDENLDTARRLGFATIEAPNMLGRRYNDGHEHAARHGYDFSFHVNSDQAFDPQLLAAIAHADPSGPVVMRALAAVDRDGRRFVAYQNPVRAMQAFPLALLKRSPRPCGETLARGCDRSTFDGVLDANPGVGETEISTGPLETVQFESDVQLTGWGRHRRLALMAGAWETEHVPWDELARLHGCGFVQKVRQFYGLEEAA